ncbi:MAG: c-type cytochrome, partial [Isosphaeraceae bacterium]
ELNSLAADASIRVRLQAVVTLGTTSAPSALDTVIAIAERDADSPWVTEAVLASPRFDANRFLDALAKGRGRWLRDPSSSQLEFLQQLAARIAATGARDSLDACIGTALNAQDEAATLALLQGVASEPSGRKRLLSPPTDLAASLRPALASLPSRLLATTVDAQKQAVVRSRAVTLLAALRSPVLSSKLTDLLVADQPLEVQTAAARALGSVGTPEIADAVLAGWDALALRTRHVLLGALSGRGDLAARLVNAVKRGSIAAVELDPATRDALLRLPDAALRESLASLLKTPQQTDRRQVVSRFEPALALEANPTRGRDLFRRHCQTCHTRGNEGNRVGPELLSVAGKPPAELLVAILDPNREVSPDGQSVVVATNSGQTLTGLIIEESSAALRLRRAEGLEDLLPRSTVEAVRPTGKSLMPEGFEQLLAGQDLADLIAYLRTTTDPQR